ncbi:hypothetical protein [Trinickia sp.]|uniref:hypothetical protein n=1 Tax=Trinickia sp. TaxID=2571163 RepID=UPI003F7E2B40
MKASTKTLLASTISVIALACAGGAYAQGAGGPGGGSAGGSAGAGAGGAAGGAGGAGGGTRGGAAPSGNTLEQPGVQPGMGNSNSTGGYGSPGTTGSRSGRSTVSPGMNDENPSDSTGGYSPQQEGQTYHGQGQQ